MEGTSGDSPVIDVRGLRRHFDVGRGRSRERTEAVDGIDFTVDAGERLAFIGPNGAGKSTSIKMLTGLLKPSGGYAQVLGLVPWESRRSLALRIGLLFGQQSQLWNELPVEDSLAMLGAIYGLSDIESTERMAELGEILDAKDLMGLPLRTMSLGQRMRCELIAALLHQPRVLFLDEPTIGLDLLAKQAFRDLLVTLNHEHGTTIFLTSHDVADIEQLADRAIVVNHGSIIYDAPVGQMRSELLSTKLVEVSLQHSDHGETLIDGLGAEVKAQFVSALTVHIEVDTAITPVQTILERVFALVTVVDLSVTDPPLEEVIGEIYRRPAG